MIFLSHQNNDKDFVGVIAHELSQMYGQDKVFYDEWSIKPGENILQSMSSGIEDCKFFFYFITENSLNSEMVNLEWTAAINKKANEQIEFIPIKADNVNPPKIISALKYLDLYTNGLDTTLLQMKEIISKENIAKKHPTFNNLIAYAHPISDMEIHFYVTAKRFFEPGGEFIILTELESNQAELFTESSMMVGTGFIKQAIPEKNLNGFKIDTMKDVRKGFYTKLVFRKKVGGLHHIDLLHIVSENKGDPIEIIQINNLSELPQL
ncbi:toll/interleukin-1 receptor domain-containing protein [Oceanobacillus oncorhynchi]|uniref:toll/interleukin-1 receptor domain-containing protein n=1 Tax=Oceanobacillus oncorhynchi TaxID=545501 RepID=UPI0018684C19|nr:toll/interleukin-1 receptor domain-containing protein [Oceanobacillus oncorhynchi]